MELEVHINLTAREPTLPVAPATNTTFSSFRPTLPVTFSTISELELFVPSESDKTKLHVGGERS